MKLGVPVSLIKGLIIVIEKGAKRKILVPIPLPPFSYVLKTYLQSGTEEAEVSQFKSRSGLGLGEVLDVSPCPLPHRESRSEKLEGKFGWSQRGAGTTLGFYNILFSPLTAWIRKLNFIEFSLFRLNILNKQVYITVHC